MVLKLLSNRLTYCYTTGVASIVLASLLVAVKPLNDWLDVHMAVLAPVVACLCVGSTFLSIMQKCIVNFFGVLFGGVLSLVWILIVRACHFAAVGTSTYNEYILVLVSSVLVFALHAFLPRRYVSVTCAVLVFTTNVVYSGDSNSPDSSPMFSMVCGLVGCAIPLLVAWAAGVLFRPWLGRFGSFEYSEFRSAVFDYYDTVIDALVYPSGFADDHFEKKRAACINYLFDKFTGETNATAMECFSEVCVLEEWAMLGLLEAAGSISQTDRSWLVGTKSHGCNGTRPFISSDPIVPVVGRFQESLLELEERARLESRGAFSNSFLRCMHAFPPIIPFSSSSLLASARFTLTVIGLCELLIYWDARDTSVDTYAMWALLPALLLADRVESIGQAIVDGGLYMVAVLLGGGIGTVCLVVNGEDRLGYLAEFFLVLLVGVWGRVFREQLGETGIVFVLGWIVTLLGNLGRDRGGALWRVALYRAAIAGVSVLVMSLSFIVIPAIRSGKKLNEDMSRVVQGMLHSIIDPKEEMKKSRSAAFYVAVQFRAERKYVFRRSRFLGQKQLENLFSQTAGLRVLGSDSGSVHAFPVVEEMARIAGKGFAITSSVQNLARRLRESSEKVSVDTAAVIRLARLWAQVEACAGIEEDGYEVF